jgi:membrane protease YdiL (CAAX protease family)
LHLLLTNAELNEILTSVAAFTFLGLVLFFAHLGERARGWRIAAYAMLAGPAGLLVLVSLANILRLLVSGAAAFGADADPQRLLVAFGLEVVAGVGTLVLLLAPVRRAAGRLLRRFRPDSAVHAVSLGLYWMVLLTLLSNQASADQLKADATAEQSSLLISVLILQVPMVLIAFIGVGLVARRGLNETRIRLGLVWPGWRWVAASVGVGLALIAFGTAWDNMMTALTPADSRAINEITSKLILDQLNGYGGAIALALAAGIGEELLFRGALTPPFGIVLAALLFAALHAQYALTLATLEIFILGMVLGWLRNRAGTTGAIIAHTVYDGVLLVAAVWYLGR